MTERFSASNAAKQMACHASANLELAIPNYQPPVADDIVRASDEGTAAHAVFELLADPAVVAKLKSEYEEKE